MRRELVEPGGFNTLVYGLQCAAALLPARAEPLELNALLFELLCSALINSLFFMTVTNGREMLQDNDLYKFMPNRSGQICLTVTEDFRPLLTVIFSQ